MARGRKEYTEEEILEYIQVANEMGIGPAMRELGYPGSHHTANKWFEQRSLELPTVTYLARKAANLGTFYKDKEKIAAVQLVIDRITEQLESGNLDADGINKLSNAMQRAMQTLNLIEGKATNVSESHTKDAQDLEIAKLVKEMEEKNEQSLAEKE